MSRPSFHRAALGRATLVVAWVRRRLRELLDPLLEPGGREVVVPGRRLRARTGAPGAREFVEGGRLAAAELAAAIGPPLAELEAILDFGCGSGRVLPHMALRSAGARCAGCDVDEAAIEWAERHLPQLRWQVSDYRPPLPFAADSFDLVYSISVFSHLGEELQDAWLAEVRRVLRPGGLALLSVHGAGAFEDFRAGTARTGWCPPEAFERAGLDEGEFVFEPYVSTRWNRGELPGIGDHYGLAFHGESYLRSHWARFFAIEQVRPRALSAWQDLVVCRKAIG